MCGRMDVGETCLSDAVEEVIEGIGGVGSEVDMSGGGIVRKS